VGSLFGPVPTADAGLALPDLPPVPLGGLLTPPGLPVGGGCASCGGGYGVFSGGDRCGCPDGACIPGQEPCSPCEGTHFYDRFLCELYRCICCPDPCYQPRWTGLANAAFFTDGVRPVTQQRFRTDCGLNVIFPDRSEYFWPRSDGMGIGPAPPAPYRSIPRLNYSEMSLYTEGATGGFSVWTNIPYLSLQPDLIGHAAGFGDMSIGTKSLLFDCELLQIGMQFTTTLPTGNFIKGLGRALVSLEPSLLVGLRISDDTFFQGQVAEWIPLGGDPLYAGAVLHYHASLNQVVARPLHNVELIGNVEFAGWSFQDGAFTDPVIGSFQKSSGETYLSLGPGVRLVVCNKIDFGIGALFSLTEDHLAQQLIRSEFRVRY
jgi:hypothetical protein